MGSVDTGLRVTELIASLSLATDLGTGQPLGHGLSTSVRAVAIASELGCGAAEIRRVQQVALLRFIGCTSDAAVTAAAVGGDDRSFVSAMALPLFGRGTESVRTIIGTVGGGQRPLRRLSTVASMLVDVGGAARTLAAHCEVATSLARRLGMEEAVSVALGHAYERWDGGGHPDGLEGEQIPLEVRIAIVARDADLVARVGGDMAEVLRARRGRAYDPRIVDACLRLPPRTDEVEWDDVLDAEPEPVAHVADLDAALSAVADFADLKSPWTRGHSPRVAELARSAATLTGAPDGEDLARAGLVHDLGRVGVENGIWDKPGALATAEWERVRLHPYLTQRILARCGPVAALADLASSHHERLDGSGYHRQLGGDHLTASAQILAVADVIAALTADRPHRPAMSMDEAAGLIGADVADARIDPRAAEAVLAAAGRIDQPLSVPNPGGLSDREVEVLALLARGHTNRSAGEALFISPKTVGRHVENIYAKLGVSTRAGATVYAMQHRLV